MIPCEECIALAICINKHEVKCPIIWVWICCDKIEEDTGVYCLRHYKHMCSKFDESKKVLKNLCTVRRPDEIDTSLIKQHPSRDLKLENL